MNNSGQLLNTLPKQIIRSIEQKPINYNIIVMGESYSGKSSLIKNIFCLGESPQANWCDDLLHEVCDMAGTANPLAQLTGTHSINLEKNNTSISASRYTINENGIRMNLTVYEIGGIGDSVYNSFDWVPAKNLIMNRYEEYHMEEDSGILDNDKRIHACLYMLSPTTNMREIDITSMYEMGQIVNVIPIIGKADMLSDEQYKEMKERIFSTLISNKVQLFDSMYVDECKKVVEINFMPLGYSSPNRPYAYGVSSTRAESDIKILRDLLISQHLVDLIEVTDKYYETYHRNKMIVDILTKKSSSISEDFQRRIELEESKIKKLLKRIEQKQSSYQMLAAQHKSIIPKELL
ncbi:septin 7 [Nematocida sp. AWRm78]|nr:septin 7 [Nematocida sp. AWRm79]KAI5184435.1 septin 7 [Nematocida sp. AWRm78]